MATHRVTYHPHRGQTTTLTIETGEPTAFGPSTASVSLAAGSRHRSADISAAWLARKVGQAAALDHGETTESARISPYKATLVDTIREFAGLVYVGRDVGPVRYSVAGSEPAGVDENMPPTSDSSPGERAAYERGPAALAARFPLGGQS